MNAVTRAIQIVGLAQLAAACGVSYQAVRKWERGRPPAERCRDIVRAVDAVAPRAVTLSQLRHDLWPDSDQLHPSEAA